MSKTFNDLKFKQHPNIKEGISAQLELKPGVFISVVAGLGMYSGGKNGVRGPINKLERISALFLSVYIYRCNSPIL